MSYSCPGCGTFLGNIKPSVGDEVAVCPACGELSSVAFASDDQGRIRTAPPPPEGCCVVQDGTSVTLSASCANSARAAVLALGAVLYSVVLFVVFYPIAFASCQDWLGAIPSWMPEPWGLNVFTGRPVSAYAIVFFSILFFMFLLPLLFVLFGFLPMAIGGKVRVTMQDTTATIFAGAGWFGRTRTVALESVQRIYVHEEPIEIHVEPAESQSSSLTWIVVDCGRPIKFGAALRRTQQFWLAGALTKLVLPPGKVPA